MCAYRCIDDTVLVLPISSQGEKIGGGIVLPGNIKERPIIATVIAVGPGRPLENGERFPSDLKVGSVVVFPRKSGDKLYIDNEEYIAIPERYILMVLSEPDDDGEYERYIPEDDEPIKVEE